MVKNEKSNKVLDKYRKKYKFITSNIIFLLHPSEGSTRVGRKRQTYLSATKLAACLPVRK